MQQADPSPLAAHRASPAELRARLEAERAGTPFLVLFDGDGAQRLFALGDPQRPVTIGRSTANHVALPWDTEVSRVHAELERLADDWTLLDDGLSRAGTWHNGERVASRKRLKDGDVIRVGQTEIAVFIPAQRRSRSKQAARAQPGPKLTPTQRRILEALVRPYKETQFATPASNQAIGEELFLSTDAVKAHVRTLCTAFGLDELPISQRRTALAVRALELGVA